MMQSEQHSGDKTSAMQRQSSQILMFEEQPSEKSQKFKCRVLSQGDDMMREKVQGNSERQIAIEIQSEGVDSSSSKFLQAENNFDVVNNIEEGKVTTEQTDEKLFLESTGFGDHKRSQDGSADDDGTIIDEGAALIDDDDDDDDELLVVEPINIAVEAKLQPLRQQTSSHLSLQSGEPDSQAQPFFSKRHNTSKARYESENNFDSTTRLYNPINPSASAGVTPNEQQTRNDMPAVLARSRTKAQLAPLPPQAKILPRKGGTASGVQRPRYHSNARVCDSQKVLPTLIIRKGQSQIRSTMSSNLQMTPVKLNKKQSHQQVKMSKAYNSAKILGSPGYVKKGAFGGALQEMVHDQVNAQIEAYSAEPINSWQCTEEYNLQVQQQLEKKAKRKVRLNLMLNAATKGVRNVPPQIDVEDIAHQYQNLKRDYNKVTAENARMKTKLTKLTSQTNTKEDLLINLNRQLLRIKYEKSVQNPIDIVALHLKPNTANEMGITVNDMDESSMPATMFQSQMTAMGGNKPQCAKLALRDADTLKLEQSALVMSLKKQMIELRKQKEAVEVEVEDLKRSTKVCVFNELDVQLETYADECKRMRGVLEESVIRQHEQQKEIQALRWQLEEMQQPRKEQVEQEVEAQVQVGQDEQKVEAAALLVEIEAEIVASADEELEVVSQKQTKEDDQDVFMHKLDSYLMPQDDNEQDDNEEEDGIAEDRVEKEGEEEDFELIAGGTKDNEALPPTGNAEATVDALNAPRATKSRLGSRARSKSVSPKRAPTKGPGPHPAATKQKSGFQKRMQAMSDNVKHKNLQITELNRQLKALFESNQRQSKQLWKKNRDLERYVKKLEREVKEPADADERKEPDEQYQQQPENLTSLPKTTILNKKRIVLVKTAKKVVKRKLQKKGGQQREIKLKATEISVDIQHLQDAAAQEAAKADNIIIGQDDPAKSDSNDGYSNFDESEKHDGDVSTQKKVSECDKAGDDDAAAESAGEYSSIKENDNEIDNDVEKKSEVLEESLKSGSFHSSLHGDDDSEISYQSHDKAIEEEDAIGSEASNQIKNLTERQNSSKPFAEESVGEDVISTGKDDVEGLDDDAKKRQSIKDVKSSEAKHSSSSNTADLLSQQNEVGVVPELLALDDSTKQDGEIDDVQVQTEEAKVGDKRDEQDQVKEELVAERSEKQLTACNEQQDIKSSSSSHQDDNLSLIDKIEQQSEEMEMEEKSCSAQTAPEGNLTANESNNMMFLGGAVVEEKLQIQPDIIAANEHLQELAAATEEGQHPLLSSKNHTSNSDLSPSTPKMMITALDKTASFDKEQRILDEDDSNDAAAFNDKTAVPDQEQRRTLLFAASTPTVNQIRSNNPSPEVLKEPAAESSETDSYTTQSLRDNDEDDDDDDDDAGNLLGSILQSDKDNDKTEQVAANQQESEQIADVQQPNEEEMLDTAEGILRELAEKLLENEWSVKDVFDHPKLIYVIPAYEGVTNIKAISAQNFLGRMHQLGFMELTQRQVACLMRVLGKYDLENAILFEDLKTLLENYGVPFEHTNEADDQDSYDGSQQNQFQQTETIPQQVLTQVDEEAEAANRQEDESPAEDQTVPKFEQSHQDADSPEKDTTNNPAEQDEELKEAIVHESPKGSKRIQFKEQEKQQAPRMEDTSDKKLKRKDSILSRVKESVIPDSAFGKLRSMVESKQMNRETLMDIFKSRSYLQKIKSAVRMSEALVINKTEFFALINQMLAQQSERSKLSPEQQLEIEACVQLTPKKPAMYAIRHIDSLFKILLEGSDA